MKKMVFLATIVCFSLSVTPALLAQEAHSVSLATNTVEGHAGFISEGGLLFGVSIDSPFYLKANVGMDGGEYPLGIQLGARFKFGEYLDIIPLGMLDQVTTESYGNVKGGGLGGKLKARFAGGVEIEGIVMKEWFQLEQGDGWRVRWDAGYRYEARFFEWKGAGVISTRNWVHGLIPNMESMSGRPDFGGLMQFRLGYMKYIEVNLAFMADSGFLATIGGRMSLDGFAALDKKEKKKGSENIKKIKSKSLYKK